MERSTCGRVAFLALLVVLVPNVDATPGDVLWDDRHHGPNAAADEQAGRLLLKGRRLFLGAAESNTNGDRDMFLRAYDAKSGDALWTDTHDVAGGSDSAFYPAVKGQTVIVAGTETDGTFGSHVRAYRAKDGGFLWSDLHRGHTYAISTGAVAVGPAVVVYGRDDNANGDDDFHVRALSARTGSELWTVSYDHAGGADGAADAASRGRVVVVAGSAESGNGDFDGMVRAYDAKTGALLWDAAIDVEGTDDFTPDVAVKGRTVFVTGSTTSGDGDTDWLVLALDLRTGAQRWEQIYDRNGESDGATDVLVVKRRVIVCGFSRATAGNLDFAVRAYEARTGALAWEDHRDPNGVNDNARHLAASGKRVYAFGTTNAGATNTLLYCYDARTGALLFDDEHDGAGGSDIDTGVAAKGKRVFLAASSKNAGGRVDILVRALSAK